MMIRTIVIEGQDQIGKAETTAGIVNTLAESNDQVFTIYYPYYALPFGTLVRYLLTGDKQIKQIEGLKHIWDTPRQLEVSGVLLALNRLETLSGIISRVDDSSILILDRGPYSMCVTTAYGVSEGIIRMDEVSSYLDKFLDMDSAFRSYLGTDKAIIQLLSQGDISVVTAGERRDSDLYEVNSIQMLTRDVYALMAKRFENWVQIVSRYDGVNPEWRDRKVILDDALRSLRSWGFEVQKNDDSPTSSSSGILIDIADTSSAQYGVGITRSDIILWRDSHSKRDESSIHSSSIRIGTYIARNVRRGFIRWPSEVQTQVGRLLSEYPEILTMSEGVFGNGFSDALKVSVN